jgi:hypothetical protein
MTVRQDHVYRVRGLPLGISSQQVGDLVSTLFEPESDTSAPQIRSLAKALDGRTMVATLSFRTISAELSGGGENEWRFDVTDFLHNLQVENEDIGRTRRSRTLTIDDHFRGLTILSSPPPSDHKVEYVKSKVYIKLAKKSSCLAISGLGGHAFGSFKEKGGSHMWLCDDLPNDLATTRIIIYGYESQLHGSQSFQDLEALATTLRTSLKRLSHLTEVCDTYPFFSV